MKINVSSRAMAAVTSGVAAVGITMVAAGPAHADYDEVHCYVQPYISCRTSPNIPAHSSQHWIRVMGSIGLDLIVYDATNGQPIYHHGGTGKWVTLSNVWGPAYYVVGGSILGSQGTVYLDNCTSGCHQRS